MVYHFPLDEKLIEGAVEVMKELIYPAEKPQEPEWVVEAISYWNKEWSKWMRNSKKNRWNAYYEMKARMCWDFVEYLEKHLWGEKKTFAETTFEWIRPISTLSPATLADIT